MKKTLLTAALLSATIWSSAQNDRSKKVETKYLNLPSFNISTIDPSSITIEFAMKDGFFGTERLKEGESICTTTGSVKDAVKVKTYHYEIPYTEPESYVVAKSGDGAVVYAAKTSETGQSVVRFGWDEKMKQGRCEYALSTNKLKNDFEKEAAAFKRGEHNKYQSSVFDKAGADAKTNVSLSYIPEEFQVYSAKGNTYNYDDLDNALEKAMAAYESIAKNGFNTNDLSRLKEAIAVWEKELETLDTEDKKARITKDIGKGLHENCARAYLYLYDFDNADKHAKAFQTLFGNFNNNQSEAFKEVAFRIKFQRMAAEANAAIVSDLAALHQKASASKSGSAPRLLGSDQFERLQSEFYKYKGTQAIDLMEEKKKEEEALIASGELNPYQKWYYPTAVGGEGILMNMPPSALSGIPVLTAFPKEICAFTEAKQVVILKNKIASVPAEIGNLKALKKLDLSGNQLTTLPAEIGQLENLETLKLSDNPIESLPKELGNCTKLTSLQVSGSKLSESQIAEIQRMLPDCKIKN